MRDCTIQEMMMNGTEAETKSMRKGIVRLTLPWPLGMKVKPWPLGVKVKFTELCSSVRFPDGDSSSSPRLLCANRPSKSDSPWSAFWLAIGARLEHASVHADLSACLWPHCSHSGPTMYEPALLARQITFR